MKYSAVFYIPAEYFTSPPELVHPEPENCHTPCRISGALVLWSPVPDRNKRKHHKNKPIREEYETDSDDDYGANSDIQSIQSVKDLTARTRQLSTRHHSSPSFSELEDSDNDVQPDDPPVETYVDYKEWTEQEKKK